MDLHLLKLTGYSGANLDPGDEDFFNECLGMMQLYHHDFIMMPHQNFSVKLIPDLHLRKMNRGEAFSKLIVSSKALQRRWRWR